MKIKELLKLDSKNIPILYFVNFVGGMLFFLPIFALYLEKELFSITNVAIVLSLEAFSFAVFLIYVFLEDKKIENEK